MVFVNLDLTDARNIAVVHYVRKKNFRRMPNWILPEKHTPKIEAIHLVAKEVKTGVGTDRRADPRFRRIAASAGRARTPAR